MGRFLVAQEKAIEVNPTGLLWGALPHGPLPFQSPKVSKPASPRFSPGSPHSPELTLPPLGDRPGHATSSITRSSPEVEQDSEADLGKTLVMADPTGELVDQRMPFLCPLHHPPESRVLLLDEGCPWNLRKSSDVSTHALFCKHVEQALDAWLRTSILKAAKDARMVSLSSDLTDRCFLSVLHLSRGWIHASWPSRDQQGWRGRC